MATERLLVRKAHEILRTKWELRFSNREAERSAQERRTSLRGKTKRG